MVQNRDIPPKVDIRARGSAIRTTNAPSNSRPILEADAPELLPLLDIIPESFIYTKSNPAYEETRQINNQGMKIEPLAFIRPICESDVAKAMSFLTRGGFPVNIRNGGHDTYGRAFVEQGVNFDMRALDAITISKDHSSAQIGGGVLSGKLANFLDSLNLFAPTGACHEVGYVGWACGGGYGSNLAKYGMGVDQILGARVVLVDGSVVDTDQDHHKELLWGLRGAGLGSFGVITELRIKLYPKFKQQAGVLTFPFSDFGRIAKGLGPAQDMPDTFGADLFVANVGIAIFVMLMYTYEVEEGKEEAAATYLARIKALGNLISSTVEYKSPAQFLIEMAPSFTAKADYIARHSVSIKQLSPTLVDLLETLPPPAGTAIVMHNCHGKAAAPNVNAVFASRLPHFVLVIEGVVSVDADEVKRKAVTEWSNTLYKRISESSLKLDKGYWSFIEPSAARLEEQFGIANAERLRTLKKQYDGNKVLKTMYPDL